VWAGGYLSYLCMCLCGCVTVVLPGSSVRDLGVYLDADVTMTSLLSPGHALQHFDKSCQQTAQHSATFSVAVLQVWNSLPASVRSLDVTYDIPPAAEDVSSSVRAFSVSRCSVITNILAPRFSASLTRFHRLPVLLLLK